MTKTDDAGAGAPLDPITLEILWNGLRSICDECFISLMRSAFSTNIKERHDHSTAFVDAAGRLIAQAKGSLPIHIASMTGLAREVIARIADGRLTDLGEGDIFIGNDPHTAGGTHLPDLNLVTPVFLDGRLAGFMTNIAHHADVGGAAKGSMAGGLSEIYQEGLRIPLVRLVRRGETVRDVLDILLLNMRLPAERRGDITAQIAACRLGAARLGEMAARHGASTVAAAVDAIVAASRKRFEAAIATIPDGVYRFEDMLDDDGLGTSDIPIRLRIEKTGARIRFDFTGSADQVPGNVNMTRNAVESAVFYALKAMLDPDLPNNQGVLDAVEIVTPKGSVTECVAPAAVALRANSSQRVVDVVLGALAEALPDRVVAAANGANTSAVFAGVDPRTGGGYVYLETLGGGMGARAAKDGKDGVQVHITNTSNLPVEAIEMEYPLRVLAYELIDGSGGAGRFRGGMGLRRIVAPVGHTCTFAGVGERFAHAPWGLFGGEPGRPGQFRVRAADGAERRVANKGAQVTLGAGQAVVIETPGAGGYGDPSARDAAAAAADRRAGKT